MRAAELANTLVEHGRVVRHRYCLLLNGPPARQGQSAVDLLSDRHYLVISDKSGQFIDASEVLPHRHADKLLGREADHILYDARGGFDATSLGIAPGSIRAGGLLVVLPPPSGNLCRFDQRCLTMLLANPLVQLDSAVPVIAMSDQIAGAPEQPYSDQQNAIEAICHVVSGQRKRPVVLVADRGRGKSAAMGMAASRLLDASTTDILVTGRSRRSSAKVFEHCSHDCLKWHPVDQLIDHRPDCGLLLIDEAASIPFTILAELLNHYPRIAMATTVHGYEGTGQGFMLRFRHLLDQKTRGWRQINLRQPIRWNPGDPLEHITNQLLILDADLPNISASLRSPAHCVVNQISRHGLLQQESLLRQCYSLLALAHYKTRPSDLAQLLDNDQLRLFTLNSDDSIVGVALAVAEGALSADLSSQIYRGERRPPGHVLPEVLTSHLGIPDAATLRYARIMRIAIHPKLQNRGYGSFFLGTLSGMLQQQADLVGSHFSVSPALIRFWRKQQFQPVRIGQSRSVQTGGHSAVVLLVTEGQKSQHGGLVVEQALTDFLTNLPAQLQQHLQDLPAACVIELLTNNTVFDIQPDSRVMQQIATFCNSNRRAETVVGALQQAAVFGLCRNVFSSPLLWVERILQGKPWQHCDGVDNARHGNEQLRADTQKLLESVDRIG